MVRPAARLETMVSMIRSYVLVYVVDKGDDFTYMGDIY